MRGHSSGRFYYAEDKKLRKMVERMFPGKSLRWISAKGMFGKNCGFLGKEAA